MRTTAFFLVAALAACGSEESEGNGHEGHSHDEAKHGGEIVELGGGDEDEGHVEMKIDHDSGTVTIWASMPDDSVMAFDEPPVLNFKAKDAPVTVTGTKKGDSWVFEHEGLKGDPQNARFRMKRGGKTYTPELTHSH